MKIRIIIDIETDSLNPTVVWVVVCKNVLTGEIHVFRRPDLNPESFLDYLKDVDCWVGHNIIAFDVPSLLRLVPGVQRPSSVYDTLVLSRLLDYLLDGGHSLETWGHRLGSKKIQFNDYSKLTEEMVEYCIQDVEVNYLLYKKFLPYLESPVWRKAIDVETFIAERCVELHTNGFHFSLDKCQSLWYNIDEQVKVLDEAIKSSFPPRASAVREITPRLTKHGTLNRSDFRWVRDGDLTAFNGGPFTLIEYSDFNPGSPSQIVGRLNEAGWKPTEKTKGHIEAIRSGDETRIARFRTTGFTVSEENLSTLPDTAPEAAKTLARRILLASRQRTLTEWINAYRVQSGRIHGSFNSIGAWTHRMSHTNPNTGNIAREDALYGSEMRSMWSCPEGSYLVGVDAESIQLRVLAHYIDDPAFTQSLLTGKKEDGTDPHSLNKLALGSSCKSRNDSKTFIYAWLLGAGVGKVASILSCSFADAKKAVDNFVEFYPGLKRVKQEVIPDDARRGYFQGFDGRWVRIFGEDVSSRMHFALAGYLQNGETLVMKHGMKIWYPKLRQMNVPFKIVNFVHDEWQTEVPDYDTGLVVANTQAEGIALAGEALGLRCPMAGSIISGHGKIAIGKNWLETH